MRAVPYDFEMAENRAPHYWAIACFVCPEGLKEFDDLKMVDGVLQCAWHRGDAKQPRFLNPAIFGPDPRREDRSLPTNLETSEV